MQSRQRLMIGMLLSGIFLLGTLACGGEAAAVPVEPGFIYTYAGEGEGFNPDAVTKDEARFSGVADLRIANDWLYIAESGNHVISRVNVVNGRYEVIAGTGEAGPIPATGSKVEGTPLPSIVSIDVDRVTGDLFIVLTQPPDIRDGTLIRISQGSGAYEVLRQSEPIHQVRVLDTDQLALNVNSRLFQFDLVTHEAHELVPGTEIRSIAIERGKSIYFAESSLDGIIKRLNTETGSIEVVAGPYEDSPLLEQVRDDVWLLSNPYPVWSSLEVAPGGQVAISDGSRFGATFGLLDPETGTMTVFAGAGPIDDTGDGGLAIEASVRSTQVVFDQSGNVYFASSDRIRRINRPPALK